MKIKKIKTKDRKPRNLQGTVQYLLSSENLKHEEDLDESDPCIESELKGKRVLAKGSINTWDGDFDGGLKELKGIDQDYKGNGGSIGHYIIAWRPGENLSYEQKLEAMQILLKNLGFADHLTVWVEHGDKPHPHIHLVVSRVSTELGPVRIGGSGASVQSESKRNGLSRLRDNEELSCARAEAEICRNQGWEPTPNALFGPDLQLIQRERDSNELKLRPRILDYEALHNRPHPARILGNTAVEILKISNSWEEALNSLANKGISLERVLKGPKAREGAYLRSGRTSLKLSALPSDFSLKNLDIRWGNPIPNQEKPELSFAAELALHVVAAKPNSEQYSLQQIINVLKKFISDSFSWEDFLNDLKRENWSVERAGGGALIVAGEHRIKFSQIPGKNSYSKLCSKFGDTIEEAKLPDDLFKIVHYHEAIAPKIKIQDVFKAKSEVAKNDQNITYLAQKNAIQVKQQSPKQRVAIEAQKIISASMHDDISIKSTIDRLFAAGFFVKLQIHRTIDERQFVSSLTFEKNGSFVALKNLSEECNKLGKIGEVFGERYNKPLPQNFVNNNEAGNGFIYFIKKCFSLITRFIPNYKKYETKHETFSNNLIIAQKVQIIESQKAIIETQQLAINGERHAIR